MGAGAGAVDPPPPPTQLRVPVYFLSRQRELFSLLKETKNVTSLEFLQRD